MGRLSFVRRILILDADTPLRAQLVASIGKTRNVDAITVANEDELMARVGFGRYAAVFADTELLTSGPERLIDAVSRAVVRPMVIIASNEKPENLDPELITLVVRKPYDVQTVMGILLSAVMDVQPDVDGAAEAAVC